MDVLMKSKNAPKLPCSVSGIAQIADDFLEHFTRKVLDIRSQLASRRVLTVNADYVHCEPSCSISERVFWNYRRWCYLTSNEVSNTNKRAWSTSHLTRES